MFYVLEQENLPVSLVTKLVASMHNVSTAVQMSLVMHESMHRHCTPIARTLQSSTGFMHLSTVYTMSLKIL